jgi:predicted anti-sigma-YlaC factor YlaD
MQSYESTTRRISQERPGICALIQDMLPFYLEGDVSPESRILIDEHLNECERCASFLAGAQSVQSHLRRETLLRSRVIEHDQRAQQIISASRRQVITIALVAAISAIALFIVIGGLMSVPQRQALPVPSVPSVEPIVPLETTPTPVSSLLLPVPPLSGN